MDLLPCNFVWCEVASRASSRGHDKMVSYLFLKGQVPFREIGKFDRSNKFPIQNFPSGIDTASSPHLLTFTQGITFPVDPNEIERILPYERHD
jgi:hypothetical protein